MIALDEDASGFSLFYCYNGPYAYVHIISTEFYHRSASIGLETAQ